jgi:hypothetical protein
MKKSLLLAVLLLSSAAQASVYVCDTEKEITIESPGGVISEEPAGNVFFIDTEKGYSVGAKFWSGSCTVNKEAISCSATSTLGLDYEDIRSVVINKELGDFTSALITGVIGYVSTGFCTEI